MNMKNVSNPFNHPLELRYPLPDHAFPPLLAIAMPSISYFRHML